jgi:predicted O-methyltransferase YrrM
MKVDLELTRRDRVVLFATTLVLLGAMVGGWFAIGSLAVGGALVLGLSFLLFVLLQNRREMLKEVRENRRESEQAFEQTEALVGLYFALSGRQSPLPKTRGWAASPDFLRLVYKQIRKEEPNLVVELGSGSSTIIGGHALQQNGAGRLLSFDHLEEYAQESREALSFHNLGDYCHVLTTPLTTYSLNGGTWKWYSLGDFGPDETVDLVIVDGPPGKLQELSRYPALPLLGEWLSEDPMFIIDDGDRKDERIMVKKWIEENPQFTSQYYETEKGAYIIQ